MQFVQNKLAIIYQRLKQQWCFLRHLWSVIPEWSEKDILTGILAYLKRLLAKVLIGDFESTIIQDIPITGTMGSGCDLGDRPVDSSSQFESSHR